MKTWLRSQPCPRVITMTMIVTVMMTRRWLWQVMMMGWCMVRRGGEGSVWTGLWWGSHQQLATATSSPGEDNTKCRRCIKLGIWANFNKKLSIYKTVKMFYWEKIYHLLRVLVLVWLKSNIHKSEVAVCHQKVLSLIYCFLTFFLKNVTFVIALGLESEVLIQETLKTYNLKFVLKN